MEWDVAGKGGAVLMKDCRTPNRNDLLRGDWLFQCCKLSLEWENGAETGSGPTQHSIQLERCGKTTGA